MSMGKSGGGGQKTYDYFGTIAGAICTGPVDALIAIIIDGQEVWPLGKIWAVGSSVVAGELWMFNSITYVAQVTHVASFANQPENPTYWAEYSFPRGGSPFDDISIHNWGLARFYWGTQAQTVDHNLQAAYNNYGEQHPDYKGIAYIVLIDFLFGREKQSAPNVEVVVRRSPNQTIVSGAGAALTDGQADLAAVQCEALTDLNMIGLDAGAIDATSFQTATDALQAKTNLCSGSVLVDTQETIRSFFDRIMGMTDNFLRLNSTTGLIETGIYNHGTTPGSYTTLTVDDFTERPKFKGTGWDSVKTRAVVRFNDRGYGYQTVSERADDPRAFRVLGDVRSMDIDRPWITRRAQAIAHGQESLRVIGRPQLTGDIVVRREKGRAIKAGDYVLLDIDLEPGGASLYQFFRVTQKTTPKSGPIKFSILADNTLTPIPWTNPTAPVVLTQDDVPAIAHLRIVEGNFSLTGEDGAVVVLAERPTNLITGFNLYFDTDTAGTFNNLGTMSNFAVRATLHADITSTTATIGIDVPAQVDSERFADQPGDIPASDDTLLCFLIKYETGGGFAGQVSEDGSGYAVVEIASISAQTLVSGSNYNLTALRGRKNTTAKAFAAASTEVWIIARAVAAPFIHAKFADIRANRIAGTTPDFGYFRLAPFTYLGTRLLSDCTSNAFHFPLKKASAPNLTLTAPATDAVTLTSPTYPASVAVTGSWADADSDLIDFQILLRKSTQTTARLITESVFTSAPGAAFDTHVFIETAGTYFLTLRAFDATGLKTEHVVTITATGAGAKVMTPVFSFNGQDMVAWDGDFTHFSSQALGLLKLTCQTPGAAINWSSRYSLSINTFDGSVHTWSDWSTYTDVNTAPAIHALMCVYDVSPVDLSATNVEPVKFQEFRAYAALGGMTTSDVMNILFQDFAFVERP
ncbi:MAG: hypothetical protein JWR19_2147 [Pedosphaera sp.]|nr:hypothetical protein [Pedosphaera sp.]